VTGMTTLSTPIPVPVLAAAARALTLAGRFTEATTLLDAAGASDPAAVSATAIPTGSVDAGGAGRTSGIPELAVLRAEAAVSADYRFGTATAEDALATAEKIVAGTGDAEAEWDLAFLQVRHRYFGELFDPAARFGSTEGRDPERITRLRHDAAALGASAPDGLHRGWAEFYLGLIADNVYGERDVAPAHYRTALTASESAGDDLLQFETLRHLGDHDHDDGDTDLARDRWERSAAHAARAGSVHGTLAQQLLLAVLARDRGDEPAAVALATEISRWAAATGATRLHSQAQAFLTGQDPTPPPPDSDS